MHYKLRCLSSNSFKNKSVVQSKLILLLFLFSVFQRNLRRSIQDKVDTSAKTQLRTLLHRLSYERVIKMINIFILIPNTIVSLFYTRCYPRDKWKWNISMTGLSYQWNSFPCEHITRSCSASLFSESGENCTMVWNHVI